MRGRNTISVSSDNNVWVIADQGNVGSNSYYWNGTTWQQSELPSSPFVSFPRSKRSPGILAVVPDNVWAGGYGLFHWNGKEWEVKSYDGSYGFIVDIEKASDGTVYTLTDTGIIMKIQ